MRGTVSFLSSKWHRDGEDVQAKYTIEVLPSLNHEGYNIEIGEFVSSKYWDDFRIIGRFRNYDIAMMVAQLLADVAATKYDKERNLINDIVKEVKDGMN